MLNEYPIAIIIEMIVMFVGQILFNLFVIKEGFEQFKKDKFTIVYLISGCFNIIAVCILLFGSRAQVSFSTDPLTHEINVDPGDLLVYLPYSLNLMIFIYIPQIFTYGIVFILTGIKKRENRGTLLIKSGSLGIANQSMVLLSENLVLFMLLGLITNIIVFGFTSLVIYLIFTGLGLAYSILLIIFGFKSDNLNFKVAGIIYVSIVGFRLVWTLVIPLFPL